MTMKIFLFVFFLYAVNAEACDVKVRGLTNSEKNQLVDAHNKLRARVANGQQPDQPSAADMKQVRWDNDLAAKAQEWANTCTGGHDSYDDRKTNKYPVVGQNYYASWAMGPGSDRKIDMYNPVQSWYDEVKDFDRNNVKSFKSSGSKVTGHYTQVVWAKTEAIGCGYVSFPDGDWTQQNIFCNYGPAGNFIGEPVYTEGRPASQCGSISTQYPGLCSS